MTFVALSCAVSLVVMVCIHLCLLGLGDEEIKHWQDIFNVKKERHKNFAAKDKKRRSGGWRRDNPQVVINGRRLSIFLIVAYCFDSNSAKFL